ncbi:MAG: glycoside hydrolase family 15 protein [Actinobacteria bacterium]|nr:glycoside hydrolase family 15 protein [Actinomycetota bacterium]
MTPSAPDSSFMPLAPVNGYLPIEDFGLIGDGCTAALVGRDGTVAWLCVPRFDDDPLFCSILDADRGGGFRLAPADAVSARQRYEPDSGVLVTEIRSATGLVRIRDCLTLRGGTDLREDAAAGRGELLRSVVVLDGHVRLNIDVDPRGGADAERRADGLRLRPLRRPDLDLQLVATVAVHGSRTEVALRAGEQAHFLLRWGGGAHRHRGVNFPALLEGTLDVWRQWSRHVDYDGPQQALVRRSAITLKMLDFFETGGLIAAPTSSLPEELGGVRNWDYRYAWVRDAAYAVYALRRAGLNAEAWGFLGWALDAVERDGHPRVLYTVDGRQPPPEKDDPELEGYRGSAPVRWGNAAADQRQHDAYGEILDCAWQWVSAGGGLEGLWPRLAELVGDAAAHWAQPDHGIWEVRTPGRVFTYSAAMCQVALDRGARIVDALHLPGDAARWRSESERVRQVILEEAWDEEVHSLTEHLGGGGVDASLLALPLRRVLDARHPRMVATVDAITRRLGTGDGLLYRYLPEESPDGLPGHEGAFLLCSFWLVDNLAYQGRLDEAHHLYESLCQRAGPLGLLPEEIDPATGGFLGNYPQAFSHVGVISSGVNLARLGGGR